MVGDGSERLRFLFDRHAFFDFDCLVQAVRPAAAFHGATGEFVNDDNFVVADDVVHVFVIEVVCAQAGVQVVEDAEVFLVIEAFVSTEDTTLDQQRFKVVVAAFGEADLLGFFVDTEIARAVFFFLRFEFRHDGIEFLIELGIHISRAGDDERGARFVDEDGVHFVHDGEVQLALQAVFRGERHVGAQVVEAEFVIGAVGNIAAVCRLFIFLRHAGNDDAGREAEKAVKLAQFFAVAAGEVVVDGNDVYAFAGKCVQVHRQRRYQCFPFTGAHFRNFALMQDDTADHLYVVMAQAEYTLARFAHHSKRFRQELVQRFALAQALAEFDGFCFQRVIIQCLHL